MECAEQQRCEHDADRAAQPEQRDGDRVEAGGVAEELVGEVVVDPGDLYRAGKTREKRLAMSIVTMIVRRTLTPA